MILALVAAVVLSNEGTIELNAVGDIMLARGVQRYLRRPDSLPLIRGGTVKALKGDLVIGNLESPITTQPTALKKQFVFRADPQGLPKIAPFFNALSVANNHALDCGEEGLFETIENLLKHEVTPIGIDGFATFNLKGVKVSLLAYCDFPRKEQGIAYFSEETLKRDVALARKESDICVVSIHWGEEYSEKPNARQKHIARLAAKLGVTLVVGHHPHVLQPIEWVRVGTRKCLVAYSLGNFIFDSHPPIAKLSGVLKCKITREGVKSYRFVPMVIEHYAPRLSSTEEHRKISRSQERDTRGQPKLR